MENLKILITGNQGLLGTECVRTLYSAHEIHGFSSKSLDIRDKDQTEGRIREIRPDVVVNCAAYTQVDACETHFQDAWEVNALGPENLAQSVRKHGGFLIHVSTDYVFDGARSIPNPYTEDDAPNPLSAYGKSKLAGEEAVRAICPAYAIVRTAWLYGEAGPNFLKTMLRLSLENPSIPRKVVNDQYGSPTWAYSLAKQIKMLAESGATGAFHATDQGCCTWFELAGTFLSLMDVKHNLVPCETRDFPTPARRPSNSILENKRLKELGLDVMPPWQDDLRAFVKANKKATAENRKRLTAPPADRFW